MSSLARPHSIFRFVLVLAALAALSSPACLFADNACLFTGNLGIQLPSVQPTTTSSVSFSCRDLGSVTPDRLLLVSPRTTQSGQQLFSVTVDTGSFTRDKGNEFQFDIYVQKVGDSGAERFQIYENPVGIFTDYLASIPITIKAASLLDSATLNAIPIHAEFEGPVFALGGDGKPLEVQLGARSSISIPATSNLNDLQAAIGEVKVVSTSCSRCWLGPITTSYDSTVQPKGSASLNLTLQPNNLYALFESAFSLNPKQSHDVLAVYVTSTPGLGGLPSLPQRIEVPVRFTPSFLYLAFAVILGSLIGFAVRRLIPDAPSSAAAPAAAPPESARFPRWGRDLLLSVATAVVVEFVGLILYNPPNTSITVFGFSLDPTQFAPTLLIAILVAGGPPVVARISQAIKI
jgi:hypothetical protein